MSGFLVLKKYPQTSELDISAQLCGCHAQVIISLDRESECRLCLPRIKHTLFCLRILFVMTFVNFTVVVLEGKSAPKMEGI